MRLWMLIAHLEALPNHKIVRVFETSVLCDVGVDRYKFFLD